MLLSGLAVMIDAHASLCCRFIASKGEVVLTGWKSAVYNPEKASSRMTTIHLLVGRLWNLVLSEEHIQLLNAECTMCATMYLMFVNFV